jgi:septal ring factor EnvC (AmiA/AmiB activator)
MNKISKNRQRLDANKRDDKSDSGKALSSETPSGKSDKDSAVRQLRKELKVAQKELQETVKELEHANSMLQRLKEEYSVVNDKLRSSNDELMASNQRLEEEIFVRVWAEDAVEKERKRFYDVLEALPAYVVLLTPDYHVPFANRFSVSVSANPSVCDAMSTCSAAPNPARFVIHIRY